MREVALTLVIPPIGRYKLFIALLISLIVVMGTVLPLYFFFAMFLDVQHSLRAVVTVSCISRDLERTTTLMLTGVLSTTDVFMDNSALTQFLGDEHSSNEMFSEKLFVTATILNQRIHQFQQMYGSGISVTEHFAELVSQRKIWLTILSVADPPVNFKENAYITSAVGSLGSVTQNYFIYNQSDVTPRTGDRGSSTR
jgi:hypothetical protein